MTDIRIIDGALVRRLLDMDSCIEAMRQAFRAVSAGSVRQPLRTALPGPGNGFLGLMPGSMTGPASLGIKIVSIFPDNFPSKPTHQGVVLLFDPIDGRPLAVIDAHAVTAIRTAAASAAATDALARPGPASLALLGYGDQAASHLDALSRVRPLRQVTLWGRDLTRARAFAAQAGVPITVAGSVEEAVTDADIICTLTAAPDPILTGAMLRPGMHINAVGSSLPAMAELDEDAVARCRLFADYADSARALGGELRRAIATGRVSEAHLLGEVGAVLDGSLAGRRTPDDITCFKSLGMAAEDLVAAQLIVSRAVAAGLGAVVPF
jgi:ornithine cyclodeaminase